MNAEELLAEKIKQYIADNNMRPGEQLPSIRKIAEIFSAGKNTVNAAIDILGYQGIVYVKPRYGTFVSNHDLLGNSYMDWGNIAKKGGGTENMPECESTYR